MRLIFFILLACGILFSCASPNNLYKKGKYKKAFNTLSKKLENEKASRSDITLLKKSLKGIDEEYVEKIEQLKSGDLEDYLEAYDKYDELISYHDKTVKLTRGDESQVNKLSSEQESLRKEIVSVFTDYGYEDYALFEKEANKFAARDAYNNFKAAKEYGSKDEALDSMIELSFQNAIIYYNVYLNNANVSIWDDNIFDDIEWNSSEFVKIDFTSMSSYECDCDIEIQIGFINFIENQRNNSQYYTQRIQDGYDSYVDTSGVTQQVPRYIDVNANYSETVYTKRANVNSNVNVRKLSPSCPLNSFGDYFAIEDEAVEYRVEGDERALPFALPPNNDRLLTDSDMEQELYEIIFNRFENRIN